MTIHNTLLDGISLDSGDFRRMMHAILGGTPGSFAGGVGATDGLAHGVTGLLDLKVSQNLTPNMGIRINAGLASIRANSAATLGPFPFYSDTEEQRTVPAAHASLTRRDLVIAKINTTGGPPVPDPELIVVAGTPGSGADPSLVGFPNCLVLARLNVPGAASSITAGMIDDLRTFAGVYPLVAGTAWPAASFTPTWANVTIGGAGAANVGRAVKVGPLAFVTASLTLGSGGVLTGAPSITNLPFALVGPAALATALYVNSSVRAFVGNALVSAGTTLDTFSHSEGTTGGVDASNPFAFGVADRIQVSATYLTA